MGLVSEAKYETHISNFEELYPEAVLVMLYDVRLEVAKKDDSFEDYSLGKVLEVIESGEYIAKGEISTRIDLSSAKKVIDTYRKYSEGGCKSCESLGREIIDAQDASVGKYCKVSDPDYDENALGDVRVKYEGKSPKVKRNYDHPCDDWKPRFSPVLEELIKREG